MKTAYEGFTALFNFKKSKSKETNNNTNNREE